MGTHLKRNGMEVQRPAWVRTMTASVGVMLIVALLGSGTTRMAYGSEDQANVKIIDRRSASERDKHFVVFCAREGNVGHAFISVGHHDYGAAACRENAFGMYPKAGKKGAKGSFLFGPVPGEIVDEHYSDTPPNATHRLIVQVNRNHVKQVNKIRNKWSDRDGNDYELLRRDCVSFVAAVADAISIATPERREAWTPQTFISKMLIMNE